jgi:tetratricopeptide (TPR) repeat protein
VLGDRYAESIVLNNLGDIAHRRGDSEAAVRYAEAALAIAREMDSPDGVAAELVNLAEAHLALGEVARADALASEAVAGLRRIGNRDYLAPALVVLGDARAALGDRAGAVAAHHEAARLNDRLGERVELAKGLDRLAALAGERGDWAVAVRLLGAARTARESAPVPPLVADRDAHERTIVAAQAAMGPAAFAALFAAGQRLTVEEALAALTRPLASLAPSPRGAWG